MKMCKALQLRVAAAADEGRQVQPSRLWKQGCPAVAAVTALTSGQAHV